MEAKTEETVAAAELVKEIKSRLAAKLAASEA